MQSQVSSKNLFTKLVCAIVIVLGVILLAVILLQTQALAEEGIKSLKTIPPVLVPFFDQDLPIILLSLTLSTAFIFLIAYEFINEVIRIAKKSKK